ncbi:uncharacterized [Tachysurus ichikawai]
MLPALVWMQRAAAHLSSDPSVLRFRKQCYLELISRGNALSAASRYAKYREAETFVYLTGFEYRDWFRDCFRVIALTWCYFWDGV